MDRGRELFEMMQHHSLYTTLNVFIHPPTQTPTSIHTTIHHLNDGNKLFNQLNSG